MTYWQDVLGNTMVVFIGIVFSLALGTFIYLMERVGRLWGAHVMIGILAVVMILFYIFGEPLLK